MWRKQIKVGIVGLLVLLITPIGMVVGCKAPVEAPPPTAPEEKVVTEYNVAIYLDYTGPYAEIAPDEEAAIKVAFNSWNESKGAELGIKVTPKFYDFRYDPAVAASQHPMVVSDIQPIAIMEDGIPYVLALMEQFPLDKVPCLHLTGGYNFFNAPHAWVFAHFTSYAEHTLGFLDWWAQNKGTPKFVAKGFETPPWHTVQSILDAYCSEKGYDYGGTKFTENIEPDMTPSVLWAMGKNPDFVIEIESAYNTIVMAKAMHEVGAFGKFALVYSIHEGLAEVGKVVGYEAIEGYYMMTPVDFISTTGRGQKIWYENVGKYAPGLSFEATPCRVFTTSLLLLQAVEKAAAAVGATNITGQAMYDVLNAGSYDGMDLCDDVTFDPEDRLSGVKGIKVYQMVNGKITDVTGGTGWQPVPYYSTKWLYK